MNTGAAVEVGWRGPAPAVATALAAGGAARGGVVGSAIGIRRLVANSGDAPSVIGIRGQAGRDAARKAIRQAIVEELYAMPGLSPGRVLLPARPGEAPYALLDTVGAPQRVHLAISHDGELSVAAIRLQGPVGIDVTQVVDVPDLQAVARDYLGPEQAARLALLPAHERPLAFARAWSEREARLKCLGLQLTEWSAALARELAACRCLPLVLPEGYTGVLAYME